jgi:diguanylate cyclase (GGDEF)-like protein/PAS domain S-box-containing protein
MSGVSSLLGDSMGLPAPNDDGNDLSAVLAAACRATADIAIVTDAEQKIAYLSPSFTEMTGYEPTDLLGRNCRVLQGPGTDTRMTLRIREVLASQQVFEGQILNYRKDGSALWLALKIVPMVVGPGVNVTHYVSVQRDITNKIAAMKQLEAQALNDHVTGLPNRVAAERAVTVAVQPSPQKDLTVAVCLIDLDNFRQVNNTLGHASGDLVLQQWANRVMSRLREGDVLARMGGDEFLLILNGIALSTTHESLPQIMSRLHEAVDRPFAIGDNLVRIGMSMGVALVPEDGADSRTILRVADEALYFAKERRSHGGSWWETASHARSHPADSKMTPDSLGSAFPEECRDALRGDGVLVHFQPIIDLRDGSITLFEALARLNLPDGQVAYPDDFLPYLSDEDLRTLFDNVLDQALRFIAGWDRGGVRPNVAVNLPPEILLDSTLPTIVAELLLTHGIEPGGLGLELLESETMTLETQRVALDKLDKLGVRLAMDDLGSGYSSLQRLSSFPFSAIKLDRGLFTHAYDRPLETLSIIATLVQMGRDLKMTVVIEGLEDESLTEAATILGAPLGQGYYFAKPMAAKDCATWSDSFKPHLHRSPIKTPLGALAYHWQSARVAAPHPLDLEHCPLTRFIRDTYRDSGAGTCVEVNSWHTLQHTPQGTHSASSQLFIQWLTDLIKPPTSQQQQPEARVLFS